MRRTLLADLALLQQKAAALVMPWARMTPLPRR